jgi:hypothetical protein
MTTTTPKFIYRDYQITGGVLLKEGIDDEKHLLWAQGFFGIPTVDATHVFDKFNSFFNKIQISTQKGRVFIIDKEVFKENKKELDYGYGKQYYVEKKYWQIFDPVRSQKEFEQKEIEEENKNQLKLL